MQSRSGGGGGMGYVAARETHNTWIPYRDGKKSRSSRPLKDTLLRLVSEHNDQVDPADKVSRRANQKNIIHVNEKRDLVLDGWRWLADGETFVPGMR